MPEYRVVMYNPFTGSGTKSHQAGGPKTLTDYIGDDVDLRIDKLQAKIVQGHAMIRQAYANAPDNPPTIFLAPEWYFRPKTYGYTEADLVTIVTKMLAFSEQEPYQQTVIVCGTVFWGWGIGTKGQKPVWTLYNCAPVIRNGNLLALVFKNWESDIDPTRRDYEKWGMYDDKRASDVEKDRANLAVIIAGQQANIQQRMRRHFGGRLNIDGKLKIDGMNIGIEICRDHNEGRLKKVVIAKEGSHEWAYIEVLVSCNTGVKPGSCFTRRNGFVLACDGGKYQPVQNLLRAAIYRCTGRDNFNPPGVTLNIWANTKKTVNPAGSQDSFDRVILFDPITVPAVPARPNAILARVWAAFGY